MLSRSSIRVPLGGPSWLFLIQHFFFIAIILWQIFEAANYKTATRGTFSVAEAAYVTSLWTQIVASVGAWIAWTVFCGTYILANRINALHEAYISGFPEVATSAAAHPDSPRPGNHSFAGAVERREYGARSYVVHGDGMVVAAMNGADATWRDERAFKAWADANPAVA